MDHDQVDNGQHSTAKSAAESRGYKDDSLYILGTGEKQERIGLGLRGSFIAGRIESRVKKSSHLCSTSEGGFY